MEKSEVESKIQEIFGEKVKIILFSVWNKIKIIAIWLVIVSVIKRLSVL